MTDHARRALLVIDVQNEYVSGFLCCIHQAADIGQRRVNVWILNQQVASIPVIVVQQLAPAQSPIFAEGSHGSELHAVVKSRTWQHKFSKKFPSAFAGTDLADWLAANHIDTLVVCGYMTHNCVDSTIKHAFHSGLAVEYLQDASGTLSYENKVGYVSAEEIHRSFSIVLQARFAAVMSTAEWLLLIRTNGTAERDNIYQSSQRALAHKTRKIA